jgi:hypothetical protein
MSVAISSDCLADIAQVRAGSRLFGHALTAWMQMFRGQELLTHTADRARNLPSGGHRRHAGAAGHQRSRPGRTNVCHVRAA